MRLTESGRAAHGEIERALKIVFSEMESGEFKTSQELRETIGIGHTFTNLRPYIAELIEKDGIRLRDITNGNSIEWHKL